MGERGQILIKDTGVYLYAHWDGYNLKVILKEALAKQWRWDDPEYLARIIFDVMVGESQGQETSYGIGTEVHGDLNYPLVTVDCANRTVSENGKKWFFNDFIEHNWKVEE